MLPIVSGCAAVQPRVFIHAQQSAFASLHLPPHFACAAYPHASPPRKLWRLLYVGDVAEVI